MEVKVAEGRGMTEADGGADWDQKHAGEGVSRKTAVKSNPKGQKQRFVVIVTDKASAIMG